MSALRAPFKAGGTTRHETIWALQDISFEIAPGETVGLIGRNGAGKSTILKILSRITEPTKGRIELYGRIGSLLEVGTGFHPELTGRENVFLNGAVLGMGRSEIERKFDEIVAFSEIEKFIDTPVKWYSSGMYLRLAFSVAVHLEPDILILDEVLAVGDGAFQVKCLNKMQEVRDQGRTILFVSHNIQAITRLCQRAIYLEGGVVLEDGPAQDVASVYLSSQLQIATEETWEDLQQAPGNDIARLRAVRVRREDGEISDMMDIRKCIRLEMEFEVLQPGYAMSPNLYLMNGEGIYLFITTDQDPDWQDRPRPAGHYISTAWIPGNFLAEGIMLVGVALSTSNPLGVVFDRARVVAFQVIDSLDGDSLRRNYLGPFPGVVRPYLRWTTEFRPRPSSATSSLAEGSHIS